MVKFQAKPENITVIGEDIDNIYISKIAGLSFIPEMIRKHKDFSIVYTPLHGTGITCVPKALKTFGFENIHILQAQAAADGNFPTVKSPNPEEKAALTMAIEKAGEINAELVLATDPDADRVGIAVKNNEGNFVLLNGNQTASILIYYLLNKWHEHGKLTGKEFIVKTIVTSELLAEIARKFDVGCFDVLTGFKYIAEIIRKFEGEKRFIGGGEESYGYLVSDFVRDKDAVISCCMIAEAAVYAREQGFTLYNLLLSIYKEFGFYYESLLSITKKGISGADEIKQMMQNFRNEPPLIINNSKVILIKDYLHQQEINTVTGDKKPIELPKSDVLQYFTGDGSKITVRPSGTEPKIKFYFGIKSPMDGPESFAAVEKGCNDKIENIKKDLGLN